METEKPLASFWLRLSVAALTVFGATLVLLATQTASGLLNTILPATISKLNISYSEIATLAILRQVAFIAAAVLTGFFGSRIGWRKSAMAGLVLTSFSVGLSGAMTTLPGFVVLHLFAGLGGGLLVTALIVQVLVDVGSHWLLASAAALYFAMKLLSSLVSVFGFVLVQQMGIRNVFLIAGGASLGIGLAGMGLIFLAMVVRRSRAWREEWLDEGRAGANKAGMALILAAVFMAAWAGLALGWFAVYASKELGMKASEIGLLYGAVGAAGLFAALASFAAGGLADLFDWLTGRFLRHRFGRLFVIGLGILLICAGLGILLSALEAKVLTAAVIMIQMGVAVLAPALFALLVSRAPARLWGAAVGLFLAAETLGNMGGIVNGAAIKALGYGSLAVIGIIVALAALAAVIVSIRFDKFSRISSAAKEDDSPSAQEE